MYFETTFHDATEQEASLPGWRQEYRQVSTGGYDGRTMAILLPGVEILRETISVGTEQMFSAPEGSMISESWRAARLLMHIKEIRSTLRHLSRDRSMP